MIELAFQQLPPASVDAGTPISFSVSVKWTDGSRAEGATYQITTGALDLQSGFLPPAADDGKISFSLMAPEEVGEHRFTLIVSAAGTQAANAEKELAFVLRTNPHRTSLAVWDVPSPVIRGSEFEVRVGAKCMAGCDLAGRDVEILDDDKKAVGRGALGATPWDGTSGLFWTTIRLKAPRRLKLHSWSASFHADKPRFTHDDTLSHFSFMTVAEPAHAVSVKVVNKATKAPVAKAQIRLGLYRAQTDAQGVAKVKVPKGEFSLIVTRTGFDIPDRVLKITKDVRVHVPAEKLPEEDPFAAWTA